MDGNLTVAAASAISQSQVSNQVALAVAQKSQSVQKQQGEAAVSLVKQAAQITSQLVSGHLDVQL